MEEGNREVQKFEISVTTKGKLTEEEMWIVAHDFMYRLQGYTTECPKELIGADIKLKPIINDSDIWKGKDNTYDSSGHLKNMNIWDWVVTHSGVVRQIIHDDMDDLSYEEISRYATPNEVNIIKK